MSLVNSQEKQKDVPIINQLNPFQSITLNIKFVSGTDQFKTDYSIQFDSIIKLFNDYLRRHHDLGLEIQGHTDNVGSKKSNLLLSQKRADKIKNVLVAMGADSKLLNSKGYGELVPIDSNKNKKGRENNRRIEIVLAYN